MFYAVGRRELLLGREISFSYVASLTAACISALILYSILHRHHSYIIIIIIIIYYYYHHHRPFCHLHAGYLQLPYFSIDNARVIYTRKV